MPVIISGMVWTLGFVGAGRVATALGVYFHARGYPITGIYSRGFESAAALAQLVDAPALHVPPQADLVFLAVPDDALVEVAAQMEGLQATRAVVHVSGVHDLQVLDGLRGQVDVGSFHPLYPFRQGTRLNGTEGMLIGIEASADWLRTALIELAQEMGGRPVVLSAGKKALYHAAAAIASNYVVTLFDVSLQMMIQAGVPAETAREALYQLMQGNLNNLRVLPSERALTGPIARGDTATLKKHLDALAGLPEADVYRVLGARTVGLAPDLTPAQRHDLLKLFKHKDS